MKVYDERPYEIDRAGPVDAWIYDFGLTHADGPLDLDRVGEAFKDAFAQAWRGEIEVDGFNRLVLSAGLTWREIAVLRALAKYLRQAGSTFSQAYMEETLSANPEIVRKLVDLFKVRFDPARGDGREDEAGEIAARIEEEIDAVASLDDDRILRSFLRLVQATLRTNYFQLADDGQPKPYLSFKFDPALVPDLPLPRPMYEIWVYSPRTEGVHLRGGRVARGGIRWSDRARGLPHRDPRAHEGADGQERRHRPGGREGRLRRQAAAVRPRGAARGGRRLLPHADARACST